MAQRVDAAERLLDLVIALTHTRRWMTKREIRERVHGYAQCASDAAFERMFERDKDTLREMGVPLLVEHDATHEDDVGYRIDAEGYTLPPVSFTPAEVGVLSLAGEAWQDAALRSSARRGLTKLRAVGPAPDPETSLGFALRIRGPGTAVDFGPLLEAIDARRAVRFTYRAASTGRVSRRTVQPWRLLSGVQGWYLLGYDVEREAPRAFKLSRLEGRLRPTGPSGAFTVPEEVDVPAMLAGAGAQTSTASLAVLPGRAAALRARGSAPEPAGAEGPLTDRERIEVPYGDIEALAAELAGYGPAVLVLGPSELREAVLRRLRAAGALDGEVPRG